MLKKSLKIVALALPVLLLVAQLIPIDRANPPSEGDIGAPPRVAAILQRACYDCHSNQTVWPWYSNIAPVSWWIASDVHEGRKELNFSVWSSYTDKKKQKKLRETGKEVSEGEMPPWFYVALHPEARLSEADLQAIRAWAAAPPPAP
jgi:cytochrome c551/c552